MGESGWSSHHTLQWASQDSHWQRMDCRSHQPRQLQPGYGQPCRGFLHSFFRWVGQCSNDVCPSIFSYQPLFCGSSRLHPTIAQWLPTLCAASVALWWPFYSSYASQPVLPGCAKRRVFFSTYCCPFTPLFSQHLRLCSLRWNASRRLACVSLVSGCMPAWRGCHRRGRHSAP